MWHNKLNGTNEQLKGLWSWTYVEFLCSLTELNQQHSKLVTSEHEPLKRALTIQKYRVEHICNSCVL